MPSGPPRRRVSRRPRLVVTIAAPDGRSVATRGLGLWLERRAPSSARGAVTVALVSDGRMRALNRSFRGTDYATDVLSFPATDQTETQRISSRRWAGLKPEPDEYLGDIVIATGVAARQADQAGHAVATELRILALHGLLHLLGYDHERDAGKMARVEAKLRKQAGLNEGLIERRR